MPTSNKRTKKKRNHKQRLRERRFKLTIISLSIMGFLLLDTVVGSVVLRENQKSFRCAHEFYHHGLREYQQRTTNWGGATYQVITNSLGMRDSQPRTVKRRHDGLRVVVLGDSFVEGIGINYEKTLTGLLADRWSDQGIEVLNAGVVSYSPKLYYLKTRYLLEHEELSFQKLIVFIDISDIQDEIFYESFQPATIPSWSANLVGWWRRRSLIAGVFDRLTTEETEVDSRFRTDADINVWMENTTAYSESTSNVEEGRWDWTVDENVFEEWGEKGLGLATQHIGQLHGLCQQHGVELAIVVYPAPPQVFRNEQDSKQVQHWEQFCEEKHIQFIDLFPVFIEYSYSGPQEVYETYFISRDVHWNEAGHALVAKEIDAALARSPGREP